MFHLITGGSGSGKSEYAEQKLMEYASHSKRNKKRYYIATMMPFGKESSFSCRSGCSSSSLIVTVPLLV